MTGSPLLGVHGVGNHRPGTSPHQAAEAVTGIWRAALEPASPGAGGRLSVHYYAHHLAGPLAQGPPAPDDLDRLAPGAAACLRRWAQDLDPFPPLSGQGHLTVPLRVLVDRIAVRRNLDRPMVRSFVARFFGEVERYLADDTARDAVIAGLAQDLERVRPRVLLAHSLGSVVAYDTLWAHPGPPIDLWITLGSPLAMPGVVLPRLREHPGPRGRPPRVRRWVTVADPGDLVAVPHGGIARCFGGVDDDVSQAVHALDFHLVVHYLSCRAVVDAVAACP
jgi:hypothetical protein